mmetsp:Transcript_87323/g.282217  ORF Transcript_87323/g.282217 Transcript_87323/m.282217 type:complete len:231 (+) Transcript_87323:1115-1807(+)
MGVSLQFRQQCFLLSIWDVCRLKRHKGCAQATWASPGAGAGDATDTARAGMPSGDGTGGNASKASSMAGGRLSTAGAEEERTGAPGGGGPSNDSSRASAKEPDPASCAEDPGMATPPAAFADDTSAAPLPPPLPAWELSRRGAGGRSGAASESAKRTSQLPWWLRVVQRRLTWEACKPKALAALAMLGNLCHSPNSWPSPGTKCLASTVLASLLLRAGGKLPGAAKPMPA